MWQDCHGGNSVKDVMDIVITSWLHLRPVPQEKFWGEGKCPEAKHHYIKLLSLYMSLYTQRLIQWTVINTVTHNWCKEYVSVERSAIHGTSRLYAHPSPRARFHRGLKDRRARGQRGLEQNLLFWTWQGQCTHELSSCGCLHKVTPVNVPAWIRDGVRRAHLWRRSYWQLMTAMRRVSFLQLCGPRKVAHALSSR